MSLPKLPPPPSLSPTEVAGLVETVVRWSWLAHPDVVRAVDGAVFPTIRANKERGQRMTVLSERGILLDDNTTPRWALLWTHGFAATHHLPGWTFAHIYPMSGDPNAYTHPANIIMLPEFLGGLTDKNGPLVPFLRYHVESVYGLPPFDGHSTPAPEKFDSVSWRYFEPEPDPVGCVRKQIAKLSNERVRLLRNLMTLPTP